jgi:hypothetical protein
MNANIQRLRKREELFQGIEVVFGYHADRHNGD